MNRCRNKKREWNKIRYEKSKEKLLTTCSMFLFTLHFVDYFLHYISCFIIQKIDVLYAHTQIFTMKWSNTITIVIITMMMTIWWELLFPPTFVIIALLYCVVWLCGIHKKVWISNTLQISLFGFPLTFH